MTKKIEKHLPEKAPKRTGRKGIGPVDDTPPEVKAFIDGAASTREQRNAKKKPPEPPQEQRLPGMEDASIEELEEAARRYAQIRDRRMALTEQEVDCKDLLLTLMKRHGKKEYRHRGIEIRVVAEQEKVKVKIEEE